MLVRQGWSTIGVITSLILRSASCLQFAIRSSWVVNEFRDIVKALHRAGIEVILDVVFNHTAECGHNGPTLGFRGIDNPTYYILEDEG